MENIINFDVLETISKIYEVSENSKFKPSIFTKLKQELKLLSEYFKMTEMQSFLLSIVFALNYKRTNTINFNEISAHLDCNPIQLLKYTKDFDFLCENEFIVKEISNFSFEVAYADSGYTVAKAVTKAIIENVQYEKETVKEYNSIIDVLEQIIKLTDLFEGEKLLKICS